MNSSKLSFKLFAADGVTIELESLVPVFHSWIQTRAIEDHLLIDVADYSHVHDGPGIVLVTHEANYSVDTRGGRLGVTYQRKQALEGSLTDRIRAALRSTAHAATLLEDRIKFRSDELEFRICDRLHAPNRAETLSALRPDLEEVFPGAKFEQSGSPAELFQLIITPAKPITLAQSAAQPAAV